MDFLDSRNSRVFKNNESQMNRYHNSKSVWFCAEFEK